MIFKNPHSKEVFHNWLRLSSTEYVQPANPARASSVKPSVEICIICYRLLTSQTVTEQLEHICVHTSKVTTNSETALLSPYEVSGHVLQATL